MVFVALDDLLNDEALLEMLYEFKKNNYYDIDVYNYTLENYKDGLKRNNSKKLLVYYANDEQELLSYLEIEFIDEKLCFLTDLTTNRKYRNNGYATIILTEVLKYLKKLNIQMMKIWVNNQKEFLHDFYKKHGFEPIYSDDMTEYNLDLSKLK